MNLFTKNCGVSLYSCGSLFEQNVCNLQALSYTIIMLGGLLKQVVKMEKGALETRMSSLSLVETLSTPTLSPHQEAVKPPSHIYLKHFAENPLCQAAQDQGVCQTHRSRLLQTRGLHSFDSSKREKTAG